MAVGVEDMLDLSDWVVVGDLLVDEGKGGVSGAVGPCQVLLADDTGQEGAGRELPLDPPRLAPRAPVRAPVRAPGAAQAQLAVAQALAEAQLMPPLLPPLAAGQPGPAQAQPPAQARMQAEAAAAVATNAAAPAQAAAQEEDSTEEAAAALAAEAPAQAQMPQEPPSPPALGPASAEALDAELLEWAQAGLSGKRLRGLRSFRALADHLAEQHLSESLSPEDWCLSLAEEIGDLIQEQAGHEWEEICAVRLTGGDGEGAQGSLVSAALARRRGVSSGLAKILRARGEACRPLLQALAAEYLRRHVHGSGDQRGDTRPPRPARCVPVTFETRPFGMTPVRGDHGDQTPGYVVDKVNHNDPSKPAARLGVKPGWVGVRLDGTDVRGLPLGQIQQLLKEAALPITIEFEAPPKALQVRGTGGLGGGRKSQDGSPAASMSPPASPPCGPQPPPPKAVVEPPQACLGGWEDPDW